MKPKFVLSLMIVAGFLSFAHAQITLTSADAPVIGDLITYANDTLPQGVSIGSGGANQTWDFSGLQTHGTTSIAYIAPESAPNNEVFPDANIVQSTDGEYGFANISSSGVLALGSVVDFFGDGNPLTVVFDTPRTLFEFPMTYNSTFSGESNFSITIDGEEFSVDSVRLDFTENYSSEVDGYGTLITPQGSYNALRQRVESITETSIFALFFGVWLPLDNSIDTTVSYQWITEEAKGQALTVDVSGDTILYATWFQSVSTVVQAPVAEFAFELQGGGEVAFTDQSTNNPEEWSWDFGDASATSNLQNPSHTYTNSGTYEVCLTATNSGGASTTCQDVTVTIVGTGEAEKQPTLKAFPNPAGNWITFEIKDLPAQELSLEIMNLSGQQLFHTTLSGNRTLDISGFVKGAYLYAVRTKDGEAVAEGRFEKQ